MVDFVKINGVEIPFCFSLRAQKEHLTPGFEDDSLGMNMAYLGVKYGYLDKKEEPMTKEEFETHADADPKGYFEILGKVIDSQPEMIKNLQALTDRAKKLNPEKEK